MIVVESADISHIRENQMPYNQDYLWSVHISVWRGFFPNWKTEAKINDRESADSTRG